MASMSHFRSAVDELYPLFFTNLSDSIPSVREGAAMALANVVKAYGEYYKKPMRTDLHETLVLNTASRYRGVNLINLN